MRLELPWVLDTTGFEVRSALDASAPNSSTLEPSVDSTFSGVHGYAREEQVSRETCTALAPVWLEQAQLSHLFCLGNRFGGERDSQTISALPDGSSLT
jgi:hypothetical protein